MRTYESKWLAKQNYIIAGVDEVGRGPLAGPVVAAAVILPNDFSHSAIRDSKTLSTSQLLAAHNIIKENALAIAASEISVEIIDEINIKNAAKLAMQNAIKKLSIKPEVVLIDYEKLELDGLLQESITHGDAKSISIAAASVVAKIYRDNLMSKLHNEFPIYNWKSNAGYGTKEHRDALQKHGYCKHHRKTFTPIKTMIKLENDK